ncbi:MAG: hypothetical protein RL302_42 [Pseudomonadota bacterium]
MGRPGGELLPPRSGVWTKKNHPRVVFFRLGRITAWLARKLQQQERLREQQLVQMRQQQELQRQERLREQQLLLFYRKQRGQQQR